MPIPIEQFNELDPAPWPYISAEDVDTVLAYLASNPQTAYTPDELTKRLDTELTPIEVCEALLELERLSLVDSAEPYWIIDIEDTVEPTVTGQRPVDNPPVEDVDTTEISPQREQRLRSIKPGGSEAEVLKLLYSNPETEYKVGSIADATNRTISHTQSVLDFLEQKDDVTTSDDGWYHADRSRHELLRLASSLRQLDRMFERYSEQ